MTFSQLPPGVGPRRRPWALPLVLLVLVAVPLLEILVLLRVGNWIGLLPTIGLLIAIAVIGTWLSRREGGKAWKGINSALQTGELPSGKMADGALVLLGAILLVFPGFLTDIVALLFLLPFTRPLMRRLVGWSLTRQAKKYGGGAMLPPLGTLGYPPREPGPSDPSPGSFDASGEVIEGEVVEGNNATPDDPTSGPHR